MTKKQAAPRKKPQEKKKTASPLRRGPKPKFSKDYVDQAYKFCLLGADDKRLAEFFDVTEQTVNNWKRAYPDFADALRRGKTVADANVAHSLYHRAVGYTHDEEKIFCSDGEVIRAETTRHYPPDAKAAMSWLKNRQKSLWVDSSTIEETKEVNITVNTTDELDAFISRISRLASRGSEGGSSGDAHK